VEREIKLTRQEHCRECHGSGARPGTRNSSCPQCGGRGQVRYQQGFFAVSRTCSKCQGRGEIVTSPCESCRGKGHVKEKRSLKVKIPAGIDDGSRLRLAGEGEAGDEGMPAGDLFVGVRIKKHPFFERDGGDLVCEITISFTQAALGARLEIPTLEGTEILKIRPGVQPGEILRMKGRGVQDLSGRRKGDLYVKVQIRTPEGLSKEQKSLLVELAKLRGEDIEAVDKSLVHKMKNIYQ
jgi:molecular chaperone DnaJ